MNYREKDEDVQDSVQPEDKAIIPSCKDISLLISEGKLFDPKILSNCFLDSEVLSLSSLKKAEGAPRAVCQYQFKKNDITWMCRTCQSDETSVLCNACWEDSKHEGHEVYYYHSQAGGCCDCGDADAWLPAGFARGMGIMSWTRLMGFHRSFSLVALSFSIRLPWR